jgi:integrase
MPAKLIGERVKRDRYLSDDELRKVWGVVDGLAYPAAPIIKLVILTGQRLREIANLSWSAIDMEQKVITIPARG